MLFRFCLYGFLKNQRYFEPFLILAFRDKGLSFAAIGLLMGFRDVCINVFEIPTGAVADTMGRRSAMICSHLAYLAAFCLFGFAQNLGGLIVAMFAFSIGEAFRTGTHKAIIFTWLKQEHREKEKTRVYGITRSWSKLGSALAVIIGAVLMFWLKDYRLIFWLSMIPIAANIVNFFSYPANLDGEKTGTGGTGVFAILLAGLRQCLRRPSLRRLLLESMGYEGIFNVTKTYLQPIIRQSALALPLFLAFDNRQRTAVLVGAVYVVLYVLSSVASRYSHRFARRSGSDRRAARNLWFLDFLAFLAMFAGIMLQREFLAIAAFVVLAVLQNLWRPLLVGRVADETDDTTMATVLSVESQTKTFFAALAAPLLGWVVDRMSGDQRFLPVAFVGICVAAMALLVPAPRAKSSTGDVLEC